MKIMMINGSPKVRGSASGALLSMLKEYFKQEIREAVWNKNFLEEEMIRELLESDAVIMAFPLYIDSVPSHLLQCMMQVEEHIRLYGGKKKVMIYVMINNGFFQGKQNLPAIEVMQHWTDRCGFGFGQALGIGGGGMIPFIKGVPRGHGPKKNLTRAFDEMAENVLKKETGNTRMFELNYPAWAYKWQAQYGWRMSARKNGLKRKDLDKQW